MSARPRFTTAAIVTLGASAMTRLCPSRDFSCSVWPSSFSTVPRIRVGVPSGGRGLGERRNRDQADKRPGES
jgi:hypothetical protein